MSILTGELHKLVFGGTLAGSEQWACSIHMATQGAETEGDAAALPLVLPPIQQWFQDGMSKTNPLATFSFIKLNRVDRSTGKYADATDSNTLFLDPVVTPGVSASDAYPAQVSLALTWHTDIMRGRASRGRIYPPTSLKTGATSFVESTGLVTAAAALDSANRAQELLAELNNATPNLTCVVWSQVGQVARAIERVSCGRVPDTQRRRRSNLDESRVFATSAV